MWYPYTFKLAYAEDNEFDLQVHTEWTCEEFIEKVSAFARMVFPSISITDTMHITESWNQSSDPGYNQMPAEENRPIPSITQKISDRYSSRYYNNLYFYIYFQNECQSLMARGSTGHSRHIEQLYVNVSHYQEIWESEIRDRHPLGHGFSRTPTGSNFNFVRSHSDRTDELHWNNMRGIVPASSVAVSLDDMLAERVNLTPSFDAETNDSEDFNQLSNLIYDTNRAYSTELYNIQATNTILSRYHPNVPILPLNRTRDTVNIIPNIEEDVELEPNGITDDDIMYCVTGDCAICFTENIPCHPLQRCSHSVCGTCYVGVFTRLNGALDIRCPMCRVDNSFSRNVYNLLTLNNV